MNRIIKRLQIQAFSNNIPIGKSTDDVNYILRRYNQDDTLLLALEIAEANSNSNRHVDMTNKYQISPNYISNTSNKSVFVTTDINAVTQDSIDLNKIYVWDIFILELTPEFIRNYIQVKEDKSKEQNKKFNLQQVINKLNKVRFVISVLCYPLSNIDRKKIIFDQTVLQSNISSVLENIIDKVAQTYPQYTIIQNVDLIQKIKDSIKDQLHVY